MYHVNLETERLTLRNFTLEDVEDFYLLNQDWNVVKYTGNPAMSSILEAETILREVVFPQYSLYNMGRLAVIEKESSRFIGFCGLKHENHVIDLGYRFRVDAWGRGYATESARCLLNHGLTDLRLPLITARADIRNMASLNVLRKIGMKWVKDVPNEDTMDSYFEKRRGEL